MSDGRENDALVDHDGLILLLRDSETDQSDADVGADLELVLKDDRFLHVVAESSQCDVATLKKSSNDCLVGSLVEEICEERSAVRVAIGRIP